MTITASDLPEDPRVDLGVLFVHGIGEQARGQTLVQFGEPLLEWVRQWMRLAGAERGLYAAVPLEARLREPLTDGGVPSHAGVLVGESVDGSVNAQGWLFAEAWWGAQAMPPRIAEFTGWLLTRGSWTLLLHLHQVCVLSVEKLRGWPRRLALWALAMPVTIGWAVASMAMNLLLLAFALIALVPFGWLRSVVYTVLRALAGVIGDAFLLIRSPTQAAAFEQATASALGWLDERAHKVVVVAHSQGAAIAHSVLQAGEAPRVAGFVSVGAGIVKLEALRQFEKLPAFERVAPLLGPPLAVLALVGSLRWWALRPDADAFFAALLLSLLALVMIGSVWQSVVAALAQLRERSQRVSLAAQQPGLLWCDVAATHDPVCAGNLTDWFDRDALAIESHSIPVLSSTLADHTNYWRSHASFMPVLAGVLDRCSGGRLLRIGAHGPRMDAARRTHQFDVGLLALFQKLDLLALALPFVAARDRVVAGVVALRAWIGSADSPLAVVDSTLTAVENAVQWAADAAGPECTTGEQVGAAVDLAAAGAVLVALLLLWRRVVYGLWQAWSASRHAVQLRRDVAGAMPVDGAARAAPAEGGRWQSIESRLRRAPALAADWLVMGLLAAVLAIPITFSTILTFRLAVIDARGLWSIPLAVWAVGMVLFVAAAMLEDLGRKLPALREWLAAQARAGFWRWDALFPIARSACFGVFGAGIVLALGGAWFEPLSAAKEIGASIGGVALFAGLGVQLLDSVRGRMIALGAPRRWRLLVLALPVVLSVAGAVAMAPWTSHEVYWRGVAAVVAVLALLTAGLEWLVVWAWQRARRGAG